jgi:bla regulator protein BlaR1
MEVYVLKSAACLGIFFLFYTLLLENTTLHTTKRGYLLASLVVSIVIPFITFTKYIEAAPMAVDVLETFVVASSKTPAIIAEPIDYLPMILWTLYALGLLFFSIRFSRNLHSLVHKIKKNPVYKEQSILYVLLQLPVTPHSFFNYIFLGKEDHQAGNIPEEVIVHERAHVEQKHSWDILFFEIFQIIFWFNPLLYFFKRSIKLNHEFLADRTVLRTGATLSTYQSILLDFSSKSSVPEMAHSINYSSIKKRFNVMKTHTSNRAAWLKGLLIMPLLALLIYGFSETKEEFITSEIALVSTTEDKILDLNISEANEIFNGNKKLAFNDLEKLVTTEGYSKTALNVAPQVHILFAKSVVAELVRLDIAKNMSICSSSNGTNGLSHDDFQEIMSPLHERFGIVTGDKVSPEKLKAYNTLAKKYNAQPIESRSIPLKDLHVLEGIFTKMSQEQKDNALSFPECLPKNKIGGTKKEQIDSFLNASKHNNQETFILQVELSEIRLNGIPVTLNKLAVTIDAFTKDWSATDFTSTRPNVLIASTPKSFLDKVDVEFRKTRFSKANDGMNIIPPPPPTNRRVKKGEASIIPPPPTSKKVLKGEVSLIPPPPPPHPPIVSTSRLDHVIRMAKEHAAFLYEGKRITSDKAIAMLKENPDLNVSTEHFKNSNPIVTLSKKVNK